MTNDTLLLKRSDVAQLITLDECISAVENAFGMYAEGKANPPGVLAVHARHGGFHIKAGILDLKRSYFVAKTNANFPSNPILNGLPTIQGIVTVSDAQDGRLLALMDSIEITILRTGAATAVAAKYLSKKDSKTATIIGCGNQGVISARMLARVRPITKIFACDIDQQKSRQYASNLSAELGFEVIATTDIRSALAQSDVAVTCTTSLKPVVQREHLREGILVVAVGSDNEEKHELDPSILKAGKVVTDLTAQCAKIGELHHAVELKLMTQEDVYAELGEIICQRKEGRASDSEIIVFDSTGTALQDVATAAVIYDKVENSGQLPRINFFH